MKGCSVGRFDRGAAFGRFDCDYRDVCSRVDHLIVSCYIKRDVANRQMLVYVPDPSAMDTEPPEDLPSTILEDATSTCLAMDSYHSGEARNTVIVSAKPSKKRAGSGRQPQSKAKRKPTSATRIYSSPSETYNEQEAPLLGMLPTLRSLGPAEVHSKIHALLNSLAPVLKLSTEQLEHLLHHFQWNTDKLMEEFFTNSVAILKGAGLSGDPSRHPPSRRQTITCPVCTLSFSSRDLLWLWCNHGCCQVHN